MHEVIIVGSGLSAIAAAFRFAHYRVRPLIIDVGHTPADEPPLQENLYLHRRSHDLFDLFIGENNEGLADLIEKDWQRTVAKLLGPRVNFVVKKGNAEAPIQQEGFIAVQSFAQGGLANAWGAGVLRYTDIELQRFPFIAADLDPYYDLLTEEMGVSGEEDDLAPFFGSSRNLQPPVRLSRNGTRILNRYQRKRALINRQGVFMGKPRSAILTEPMSGRQALDYSQQEFVRADLPYIYTPRVTLGTLLDRKAVDYESQIQVLDWVREKDTIIVHARDLAGNTHRAFRCKKLILAAGAINTAKIVLTAKKDYKVSLPLLDNPLLQFPLFLFPFLGMPLDTEAFGGGQLIVMIDRDTNRAPLLASLIELTAPPRAAFFPYFPFSARTNLHLVRSILPSMMIMQLYFSSDASADGTMRLREDGTVVINGGNFGYDSDIVNILLWALRKLGAFSSRKLIASPPIGQHMHYGGGLPMTEAPAAPYQCSPIGELFGEPGVHLVDGSAFPHIPAKNHSFTLMANSMRIADGIANNLIGG